MLDNRLRHDFSEIIDRRASDAKKFDSRLYPADVQPMWIADTDFRCPAPVVDAVAQRARHGLYGYPLHDERFEDSLAHWLHTRFQCDIERDWVVFAPGVMPGIAYAVQGLTQPGDGVVIQPPIYPPFRQVLQNNNREVLENPLQLREGRYSIDFEGLESLLAQPRTKMMLVCNPHNPTGRVFSAMELACMAELCERHGVVLVSDEIHCDIVYGDAEHKPLFSLSGPVERYGIACYNPSKTFNTPGLRTAAMVIPNPQLRRQVEKAIWAAKAYGRTVFGPLAFQTAYFECAYYADQLVEYLSENLALVKKNLAGQKRVRLIEPEGTYLLWLDCRGLWLKGEALEAFFVRQCKLGRNAGVGFGKEGEGFMRMNIACPRAVLEAALNNLLAALEKADESCGQRREGT